MNPQVRMIETRTFRIAVIAVAAAVLLAAAAYLFGTGLRADTSASVAPSPLGSSLINVRQARAAAPSALGANSLDARGARTILSAARAASLAALAKSRSDFSATQSVWALTEAALAKNRAELQNNQSVWALTARAAALAPLSTGRGDIYQYLKNSAVAADTYSNAWMGFTSPESVAPRVSVAPDPEAHQSP